tara:strand:- start:432 stop:623 length:192 start_codon:yes stop_codon:yes gene_type:complete
MSSSGNIDSASLLIEDIEDIIESIKKNFLFSEELEASPLSEDFIDDLLEKLEMAHTELVNAFY